MLFNNNQWLFFGAISRRRELPGAITHTCIYTYIYIYIPSTYDMSLYYIEVITVYRLMLVILSYITQSITYHAAVHCILGEHKPGRIKPGRIKRAALSLRNQT